MKIRPKDNLKKKNPRCILSLQTLNFTEVFSYEIL
jgi:hypothetical protein